MLTSTKFTKLPEAVLAFQDYAFMTMDGATAVGSWGIIPSYLPYLDSPMFQTTRSWNDFLYSLLVFGNENSRTAPLGLALFRGSEINSPRFTVMFAGSALATLPLLAIFFAFQRRLMDGIMAGAIKG
jgi:ABC-type glycerol-3-phosphate transport system permease component